jgi:hypothetical protein
MKSVPPFSGFTPDTIQFLVDLKENNFRQWFEDHRELYEIELLQPFRALVNTLSPVMYAIDPCLSSVPTQSVVAYLPRYPLLRNKDPYKHLPLDEFPAYGYVVGEFSGIFHGTQYRAGIVGYGTLCSQTESDGCFRERVETEPGPFGRWWRRR